MTTPFTGARTQLVTRVVCAVTASEIATYRDVLRSDIAALRPDEDAPEASPIHAFVLTSPTFDQAVRVLGSAGQDAPEPTGRLHLSQAIHLQRLVRPDERVTIEVDVLGARREPRGVRLALRSVLVGGDGSPFAELVTGVLLVGATAPDPFGHIPPHPQHGSTTGQTVFVTRQVSTEMVRRYAEASGDHNPIHLDPAAARAAGLPGLIAHGMCVMALVCEEVIDRYAAGDATRIRAIGGRFSSPVLPEQPLDISIQPDGDGRIVRFSCKTPQGVALKNGWAEIAADTDGRKRHGDG
jgi:acyl dehydratase